MDKSTNTGQRKHISVDSTEACGLFARIPTREAQDTSACNGFSCDTRSAIAVTDPPVASRIGDTYLHCSVV
jgi:hypothetical protein